MEPHIPYEPPKKMRRSSANADPGETVTMEKDPQFKQLIAEAKAFGQKFKNTADKKRKKRKMSQQEKQRLKTPGYIE